MELLDKIIADIPGQIALLNDKDLSSDKTEKELVKQKTLDAPELDLKNKTVEVKREELTGKNTPDGLSSRPGQQIELVAYTVPVVGDLFLFKQIFPSLTRSKKYGLMFKRSNLIYKEYSLNEIEGDNEMLERIKNNAKSEIDAVQRALQPLNDHIKEFNERRLPDAVKTAIEREKSERNSKKDTRSKLDF